MSDKAILTCALTGVLTDPSMANIPVTPEEMAEAARQAWDQGATIVHCHFRDQRPGKGMLPTWDVEVVKSIIDAIRDRVPGIIVNQSTGVIGPDISQPAACLKAIRLGKREPRGSLTHSRRCPMNIQLSDVTLHIDETLMAELAEIKKKRK